MTATLDTNILLRLALGDVPHQYEQARNLVTTPGTRYRVTVTAINEMVHALLHHYQFSRDQTAEVIRAILAEPSLDLDRALIGGTLDQFCTHHSLSYTDCFLAEEARNSGHQPLLTFDKALAKGHDCAQLLDKNASL